MDELRKFNFDFCRRFSSAKLRLIYKDEDSALIEKLIEAVHGKQEPEQKPEKKTRKKKEIE